MKISLKQLQVFVNIAKYGSISLAIQKLHITQSACSMALATLEKQLNFPLFDRRGRKLILNELGSDFFPKAANLLMEAKELEDFNLSHNTAILTGSLIIGASLTIADYILPKIIVDFINDYPGVNICLQNSNTTQIVQQLLKFNLDFGIVEGAFKSDKIESTIWKKDTLIIVVAPSNTLTKKRNIHLSDLLCEKWVMREHGSGMRKSLESALGESVSPILELNSVEGIKTAVMLGAGISCLPRSSVVELLHQKKLIEIKTPFLNLTRNFTILRHIERRSTLLSDQLIRKLMNNREVEGQA